MMVSIIPRSPREHQIAHSLGVDDWLLIERRVFVHCFNQSGCLVEKNGHLRWIRENQIKEAE